MSTKVSGSRSILRIAEMYVDAGGKQPYTTRDVAEWAVANGHYSKQTSTVVSLCAKELARALREDYYIDSKGRSVRAQHAVKVRRNDKQLTLWVDHRTGSRDMLHRSFQQRRMQIVGDCRQLKTDVDSFNDNRPNAVPIQMVLDFRDDIDELDDNSGKPGRPR